MSDKWWLKGRTPKVKITDDYRVIELKHRTLKERKAIAEALYLTLTQEAN